MKKILYSILDPAPIRQGGGAALAFCNTFDLAKRTERWGYHRYRLTAGLQARALEHAVAHIVPEHFTEVKTRKHQWIAKTEAAVKDRAHQGNCVLGSPIKLLRTSPASSVPM